MLLLFPFSPSAHRVCHMHKLWLFCETQTGSLVFLWNCCTAQVPRWHGSSCPRWFVSPLLVIGVPPRHRALWVRDLPEWLELDTSCSIHSPHRKLVHIFCTTHTKIGWLLLPFLWANSCLEKAPEAAKFLYRPKLLRSLSPCSDGSLDATDKCGSASIQPRLARLVSPSCSREFLSAAYSPTGTAFPAFPPR